MPGCGYSHFWESDPRRWERCKQQAGSKMIEEGWNPHARKFNDVRFKRARRLWNNK